MSEQRPDDVLTPGGYRPRSFVQHISSGDQVRATGAAPPFVEQTRTTGADGRDSRGRVLTPGGFRHPALVHRIDAGHVIDAASSRLRLLRRDADEVVEVPHVSVQPGDVPGFGTGWITYAYWQNRTGQPVTDFITRWRVPKAPTSSSGQTIFLFNGIDPSNPSQAILQPVLQWGVSAAGGGNYWAVASWFVDNSGHAFHTNLVQVSEGDLLDGHMALTGQAPNSFSYSSEFTGIANTMLQVQTADELVWCNQTLEAYAITSCSDYPADTLTHMGQIDIRTGQLTPTVDWTPADQVTDCNQHTIVVSNTGSNGAVDLYYRNPQPFDMDKLSQVFRILVGITNDGGGIGVLSDGHIIRVPPHNPLWQQVVPLIEDVVSTLAVQEDVRGRVGAEYEAVRRAMFDAVSVRLKAASETIGGM
jgi:hypothetical protein